MVGSRRRSIRVCATNRKSSHGVLEQLDVEKKLGHGGRRNYEAPGDGKTRCTGSFGRSTRG